MAKEDVCEITSRLHVVSWQRRRTCDNMWGEPVDADIGDEPAQQIERTPKSSHLVNYDGKKKGSM